MAEALRLSRLVVPRGRIVAYNALCAHTRASYPPNAKRTYASNQTSLGTTGTTSGPSTPHKRVTVFNDDGHIKWGDLNRVEKVARTAQQSFNFGLVIGGAALTAAIFTLLYTDVFSPQSSVSHFNHAIDHIRTDPRTISLLGGPGPDIRGYGEPSWNKWRRNRPIAHTTTTDKFGTESLNMHFNVSGSASDGVAHLHMVRRKDESAFSYGYLAVDVRGHERVYLENANAAKTTGKKTPGTFLGFKWT